MGLNAGLLAFDATGRVRCSINPPVLSTGGTPTTAAGLLAISANAPTLYVGGLGYHGPSQNALAVDVGGAASFYNAGFGFTSAGRLALDSVGAITVYLARIPRTAGGGIACVVE
jgi:hypothetical protein